MEGFIINLLVRHRLWKCAFIAYMTCSIILSHSDPETFYFCALKLKGMTDFNDNCFVSIDVIPFKYNCHGSACPTPFPITAHALTWSHLSLIEHTCNHSPLPFISALTSVTRRLVSRSQGCMYAALYTGHCLPVCPGSGPRLRKRKFTYSATVHPASKGFFVISPMLETLPWKDQNYF